MSESSTDHGQGGSGNRRASNVIVAVVGVLALIVAAFVVVTAISGDDTASAEVTLRAFAERGDDPFTASIAPEPSATLADFAENGAAPDAELVSGLAGASSTDASTGGYRSIDGAVPGLFGGTLDELTCDSLQLIDFLEAEPAKAAAWASAIRIDVGDIGAYIDTLTAANLVVDTRVLEHGFADGELAPRESILQRGTAVLVDARGVPRVNCYSGNPLRDPTVVDDESYDGDRWNSFEPTEVLIIRPALQDTDDFVLFDVEEGVVFQRPAGSTGELDMTAAEAAAADEADTTGQDGGQGDPQTGDEEPVTRVLPDAGPVELNTLVPGEITSSDPEVIYQFDATGGAVLNLTVANDRASIRALGVAVRSQGENFTFFRVSPGATEEFAILLGHDRGGPFDVAFSEGPAAFEFRIDGAVQNDGDSGGDAGNAFASAFEITSGQAVDGQLGDRDDGDVYVLEAEGAPELVFTAAVPRDSDGRAAFDVQLVGERLDFVRVSPGADHRHSVLLGPDDDGLLEFLVTEGPALYGFVAELIPQADGGRPGDASAELTDARLLEDLTDLTGQVGDRDRSDLFLFEASSAEMTLDVFITESSSRVAVELIGPDGNGLEFRRINPGVSESVTFAATPGETYRLEFSEGRGVYEFSIS